MCARSLEMRKLPRTSDPAWYAQRIRVASAGIDGCIAGTRSGNVRNALERRRCGSSSRTLCRRSARWRTTSTSVLTFTGRQRSDRSCVRPICLGMTGVLQRDVIAVSARERAQRRATRKPSKNWTSHALTWWARHADERRTMHAPNPVVVETGEFPVQSQESGATVWRGCATLCGVHARRRSRSTCIADVVTVKIVEPLEAIQVVVHDAQTPPGAWPELAHERVARRRPRAVPQTNQRSL